MRKKMKLPDEEWHVQQSLKAVKKLGRGRARFCRVYPGEKRPVGTDWQNAVYSSESSKLLNWIKEPQADSDRNRKGHTGNYGVVGGYGDLTILDEDDPRITELRKANLPDTLVVSTCHNDRHSYFCVPNFGGSIRFQDPDDPGTVVGDIQDEGKQVLGPGSVVYPEYDQKAGTGGYYEIVNDKLPAFVKEREIKEAFGDFINVRRKEGGKKGKKKGPIHRSETENSHSIKITEVGKIREAIESGELKWKRGGKWDGYYVGPHPVHGSETGQNFHVVPKLNSWHCFRNGHNSGGGPYYWLAVEEGIIDCSEAYKDSPALRGDKFKEVIDIAVKRGLITEGEARVIGVISPETSTEVGEPVKTFEIGGS